MVMHYQRLFLMRNVGMKKEEKIRQLAIDICKARGLDPKRLVCSHHPELINGPYMAGFFIPNFNFQMPAWRLFTSDAELALEAVESFKDA